MRRRFRWSPAQQCLVEVTPFDESEVRAPAVFGDYEAYTSPIDGRVVDGKRQRREDLKRHGCRPYENGETQMAQQRRQAADAALERSVNNTVERWWYEAPTAKREALARELIAGTDTRIVRK